MRVIIIAGLTAVSLAACSQGGEGQTDAAAPAAKARAEATAAGLPTGPTPGLWKITTQMSGMPAGMTPPSVQTCIREAKFETPTVPASRGSGVQCEQQSFRREGDAVVGHSVCTLSNGARTVTDTRMSGDFTRLYTMEVKAVTTPAPTPAMSEMSMTMTAERLGDCPAPAAP